MSASATSTDEIDWSDCDDKEVTGDQDWPHCSMEEPSEEQDLGAGEYVSRPEVL
jgi:hypothetical protein